MKFIILIDELYFFSGWGRYTNHQLDMDGGKFHGWNGRDTCSRSAETPDPSATLQRDMGCASSMLGQWEGFLLAVVL